MESGKIYAKMEKTQRVKHVPMGLFLGKAVRHVVMTKSWPQLRMTVSVRNPLSLEAEVLVCSGRFLKAAEVDGC